MKDIILVGIQGSGKGTQARILAEKLGYQIFETGAELRSIARENSPLGQKVKAITERGDLVPNEIVMEIVENFFHKISSSTPVIFDGIPRSEPQRLSLQKLLSSHKRDFLVLEIRLSESEAMKRLLLRAKTEGRADDTPAVIQKRIQNFYAHTEPLLEHWNNEKKLLSIDGDQSIAEVTKEILERLKH